jgi:hypothetical protein
MLGKSLMAILISATFGLIVWQRMPLGMFALLDIVVLATLFAPRQDITMFDKAYARYQAWKASRESTVIIVEKPEMNKELKVSRLSEWGKTLKGRLNRPVVSLARFKPKPLRFGARWPRKKPAEPVVKVEPPVYKKTRSPDWVDPYLKGYEATENGDNKKAA